MAFFGLFKSNKEIEKRDIQSDTSISSLFATERYIDEETVLKIPTVKSCYELIADTIAQLPIYLYKETDDGSVEKIPDYRNDLLNTEPNEFQTGYNLKKQMVKDYLFRGVTYNYVEKVGNTVTEIVNLKAKNIRVQKYIEGGFRIVDADIQVIGHEPDAIQRHSKKPIQVMSSFKPYECIIALKDSSDGVTSQGILHYGKDVFNVALEEKDYTANIYKNGALPLGVLKSAQRLTQGVIDRLRESWSTLYSGSKNAGKTVILEEGLDYSSVSLKPSELLLTENRKDVVSDVCKLFNLPESLIDVTKIKYGSLEQNNIHFLQYTLSPIITSIENGCNKTLLLEDEKAQGYFFAFDTSEVLRSTDKEKYEAVGVAMDKGVMSVNEARYKLNLPSIKDDIMKWTLGAVLYYPKTGEMKVPNMGIGIPGYDGKNRGVETKPIQTEENKEEVNDT